MGLGLGNLLDPGALAHQLVDSFLPKDMQWVGGVVGAAVDYQIGNVPGAVSQGASTLSDMKDVPQGSTPAKPPTSGSAGTRVAAAPTPLVDQQWDYEPSAPQPRPSATVTSTATRQAAGSAPPEASKPATQAAAEAPASPPPSGALDAYLHQPLTRSPAQTSHVPARPTAPTPAAIQGMPPAKLVAPTPTALHGTPPAKAAAPTATAAATTTTITITTSPTSPPDASSAAAAAAPTSGPVAPRADLATNLATKAGTTTPSTPKPTSTDAPAKPAATAPSSKSGTDTSTLSKDSFLSLGNDDLMKAIRDGNIPAAVTDSQAGMLALQARMNHISEMNQMMTSMMQAMHQMKMSVIENLRV